MNHEWNVDNLDKIQAHWLLREECLLSPYPKGYVENMRWRLKLLRKCDEDAEFREKTKKLFFSDPLFAFNAFFYTLDVRRRPRHHRPFTTYPYQDLVILTKVEHIKEGKDLVEEKSRDMGASWTTIGVYVWLWLHPEGGYDFLLGSRIEDYVDKRGDMRTLFEKARYLIQRLPKWLLPKGWKPKRDDNFMKLVNVETGASITGESNNANFGTGGRYKAIFPDEFAKWKDTDAAAWTSMADATPCRMPASTPFGAFGQYFEIITDGKTKKLTIHWSLHPQKGIGAYCVYPKPKDLPKDGEINWLNWKGERAWLRSPWYDAEEKRRKGREMSQELDIDYVGSGSPVFTGPAQSRIMALLRSRKTPKEVFEFDLDMNLVPLEWKEVSDTEGKLIVYESVDKWSTEIVGVDVVEGKEHGDYAVIKGMNRERRSCAFTYYSRIDEALLSKALSSIDEWICSRKEQADMEPWIAIETNGPGLATFDLCVEKYDMTNLFLTPNFDSAREAIVYQKGWRTTTASRKKLVGAWKEWLIDGVGWIDERCAKELTSFIYKNPNRPEAAPGTNDDEVIAWGICLVVDELLPGGEYVVPEALRSDGIPESAFILDMHKIEEPSFEDKCFECLQRKKEINDEIQIYMP